MYQILFDLLKNPEKAARHCHFHNSHIPLSAAGFSNNLLLFYSTTFILVSLSHTGTEILVLLRNVSNDLIRKITLYLFSDTDFYACTRSYTYFFTTLSCKYTARLASSFLFSLVLYISFFI